MNILHLLVDGPREEAAQMIDVQSRLHDVEVVDLTGNDVAYAELVDKIDSHDRVISWQAMTGDTGAAAEKVRS